MPRAEYFIKPWVLGEEQFQGKGDPDGYEIKYFDQASAEKYGGTYWWFSIGRIYDRELAEQIIKTMNEKFYREGMVRDGKSSPEKS